MSNDYSLSLSAVVLNGEESTLVHHLIVDNDAISMIDQAMNLIDPDSAARIGQYSITDIMPALCAARRTFGARYAATKINAFLDECHAAAVGTPYYTTGVAHPNAPVVLTPDELAARIPYAFLTIDG